MEKALGIKILYFSVYNLIQEFKFMYGRINEWDLVAFGIG